MNRWLTIAEVPTVNWDRECLAALTSGHQTTIVRPTTDRQFAVIALWGRRVRVVKVLPTLSQARAYNAALHE